MKTEKVLKNKNMKQTGGTARVNLTCFRFIRPLEDGVIKTNHRIKCKYQENKDAL